VAFQVRQQRARACSADWSSSRKDTTVAADPEAGEESDVRAVGVTAFYVDGWLERDDPRGPRRRNAFVDFYSDTVKRKLHASSRVHARRAGDRERLHTTGEHTVMPLSYRAEPHAEPAAAPDAPPRRAHTAEPAPQTGRRGHGPVRIALGDDLGEVFIGCPHPTGEFLDRVAGEEQHHSSWLFGDPVTPILRCYKGDPARIRLVHGGGSRRPMSSTCTCTSGGPCRRTPPKPRCGTSTAPARSTRLAAARLDHHRPARPRFDIDPLYGSGSRQKSVGDIVWHCPSIPTSTTACGGCGAASTAAWTALRAYPDGTPCFPLVELPGARRSSGAGQAGLPVFIDGLHPQKSPPPPALLDAHMTWRRRCLRWALHSPPSAKAFDPA
jgi:hypothetical protein